MSDIEVKVIKDDYCFQEYGAEKIHYFVTLIINKNTEFCIADDHTFSLEFYEKLLSCMKKGEKYRGSAGGNSYTYIDYENGLLEFGSDVSGNGGDSAFSFKLKTQEGISLVEKIIDGLKNAEFD